MKHGASAYVHGKCRCDGLTVWHADHAATVLGVHPAELWGDHWHAVALLDEHVARCRARDERWVRAWVARHRFEHTHQSQQRRSRTRSRRATPLAASTGAAPPA